MEHDQELDYLGVDYEDLSLWNSNSSVTEFISVSVAKSRVKRVIIRREQSLDILQETVLCIRRGKTI